MFDPPAISRIEALLNPQAFYVTAHQEIYQTCLQLDRQGKSTDFISISTHLSDRDRLDKVGGTAKLAQLLNRTVLAVNIDRYVDLMMDKFHRRRVIEIGYKIVDFGYDSTERVGKAAIRFRYLWKSFSISTRTYLRLFKLAIFFPQLI